MDDHPPSDSLVPRYRRVILKLSGEAFCTPGKSGISIDETLNVARQAKRVVERGVQLAIVIGAGNILRGAQFSGVFLKTALRTRFTLGRVCAVADLLVRAAWAPVAVMIS